MAPNDREPQLNDLGDRIAKGIREGLAAERPPQRIKPGSSQFDPKSPFRSKHGPKIKGSAYFQGIWMNEDQHTDEEIKLLNSITRSGRYINRIVEVRVQDDAGQRTVFISFNDKGIDQRMDNKNYWRNLTELLSKIVEEQGALVTA